MELTCAINGFKKILFPCLTSGSMTVNLKIKLACILCLYALTFPVEMLICNVKNNEHEQIGQYGSENYNNYPYYFGFHIFYFRQLILTGLPFPFKFQ